MMYKKVVFLITLALVLGLAGNASGVLVGRWIFDGDANDSSGNNHHGTLVVGDANTSIGFVYDAERGRDVLDCNNPVGHTSCTAVDCNGGPSDIPDPCWAEIQTAITMGGWTKVRTIHSTNYMLARGAAYQMSSIPDGRFRPFFNYVADTAQYSTSSLLDDQWHHIACTYDSVATKRYVYFDGELETTETATGVIGTHTAGLTIGGRLDSPGTFGFRGWNGLISDVRVYDNALPYVEIRAWAENYKAYLPVPTDGTIDLDKTTAQVSWSGQPTTTNYRVYLGTDEMLVTNGDASVDKGQVAGGAAGSYNGAPMGALELGTVFYWRVDANMSGTIAEGDIWDFETKPATSSDPDPWDGCKYVKTSRQISWIAGAGAIESVVFIGTDQTLVDNGDASVYETTVAAPDPCVANPALVADTTYYWKADSNTGTKYTEGNVWTFKTMPGAVEPNLVGYWPLDEKFGGSTVTWDISGNEHHGTLKQGDATTSVDIVSDPDRGNVLECDNPVGNTINSVVVCGGGSTSGGWAEIQDKITLMGWTKVDTWHTTHYLITRGAPYQMTINNSNGNLRTYWNNLSDMYQYGYINLADNGWHHVAMTYDSTATERKVYTDGKLQSTENPTGLLGTHTGGFVIGGRDQVNYTERGWDGLIDDVKLYDRVVAGWEIRRYVADCGTCMGDLDANSVVDLDDLNQLVGDLTLAKINCGQWLITKTICPAYWKNCSDMDLDGDIDLQDLNRMVGNLTWEKIWWDNWYYPCGKYNP